MTLGDGAPLQHEEVEVSALLTTERRDIVALFPHHPRAAEDAFLKRTGDPAQANGLFAPVFEKPLVESAITT